MGKAVGEPLWVLYESGSVVLRRSRDLAEVFEAAAYHLGVVAAAARHPERLPLLARIIVDPDGRAHVTDPYVASSLPGMDRAARRRGYVILPTTIASIDVDRGELHLPDHQLSANLPTGIIPIGSVLFRTLPGQPIDGVEHLRLARHVMRTANTDITHVIAQIDQAVAHPRLRPRLVDTEALEAEVASLLR